MNSQPALLASLVLAASLIATPSTAQTPTTDDAKPTPCHWWQFHRCDQKLVEGLPEEASRNGVVITIDVATNTAYLFRDGDLISKSAAATGPGAPFTSGPTADPSKGVAVQRPPASAEYSTMDVLIVGATGYVGSAVERAFASRFHRTAATARSETP